MGGGGRKGRSLPFLGSGFFGGVTWGFFFVYQGFAVFGGCFFRSFIERASVRCCVEVFGIYVDIFLFVDRVERSGSGVVYRFSCFPDAQR